MYETNKLTAIIRVHKHWISMNVPLSVRISFGTPEGRFMEKGFEARIYKFKAFCIWCPVSWDTLAPIECHCDWCRCPETMLNISRRVKCDVMDVTATEADGW